MEGACIALSDLIINTDSAASQEPWAPSSNSGQKPPIFFGFKKRKVCSLIDKHVVLTFSPASSHLGMVARTVSLKPSEEADERWQAHKKGRLGPRAVAPPSLQNADFLPFCLPHPLPGTHAPSRRGPINCSVSSRSIGRGLEPYVAGTHARFQKARFGLGALRVPSGAHSRAPLLLSLSPPTAAWGPGAALVCPPPPASPRPLRTCREVEGTGRQS